jgi:hypothetical protein
VPAEWLPSRMGAVRDTCGVVFHPEGGINYQIFKDEVIIETPIGHICGKPAVDFIEFFGGGRTWLCAEHFDEYQRCYKRSEAKLKAIFESVK